MLRKWKKSIALLLAVMLSFGMKTTVLAAESEDDQEDEVVINLFDPNDPSLVAIVDVTERERTTSRPTKLWNMDVDGDYTYSAYSNNNIMWSKYRFFDPGNLGCFKITANSNSINYQLIVYNCDDKRDYVYEIHSKNVTCNTWNFDGWGTPDWIYFGIDTTKTKSAVSVNGVVRLG